MREKLVKLQKLQELTDKEMADDLHISREYWNYMKNGKKPLTRNVRANAIVVYPKLEHIFLSENITISNIIRRRRPSKPEKRP
jgi:hypothetical protein